MVVDELEVVESGLGTESIVEHDHGVEGTVAHADHDYAERVLASLDYGLYCLHLILGGDCSVGDYEQYVVWILGDGRVGALVVSYLLLFATNDVY